MKLIACLCNYLRRLFKRAIVHPAQETSKTSVQLPMRERELVCQGLHGPHTMAYVEWGAEDNPKVLICVHGLTRNSRDFDFLAQALADKYRVICPDVAGRGRSGWLTHSADYGFPLYIADMYALIAHLGVKSVDWVGTSMGGLIGMMIAAQSSHLIRRLVLNDVGPVVTAESLQRIAKYTGNAPLFDDLSAAVAYTRSVSAPFGDHTDEQWLHLTRHTVKQRDDGKYEMVYDPSIAEPFRMTMVFADVNLWPVYDMIRARTLVIHGANSDLLTAETVRQMGQRGPKAKTVDIPNVGHAPTLMNDVQIAIVREFLLED